MSLKKLAKVSNRLVGNKDNKQVLFRNIIEGFTGHPIKRYPNSITDDLSKICQRAMKLANKSMNFKEESNKIGTKFEQYFEQSVKNTYRWKSWSPKTTLNKHLSSGYPDSVAMRRRRFTWFKTKMYIEIKTASKSSLDSSAPSFSWQNSIHGKIQESLPHVLVSFIRDGGKFIGYKIVDLYNLRVGIEVKAVTGNKSIYMNIKKDAL